MTHTDPITIELKYCELCGGLFFRPSHSHYTFCSPCVQNPRFLLRDRALTDPASAPHQPPLADAGKSPAQQHAAWYGPMTGTIHRLDAAWNAGASPATESRELANQALPATCSVSQPRPAVSEPANIFPVEASLANASLLATCDPGPVTLLPTCDLRPATSYLSGGAA